MAPKASSGVPVSTDTGMPPPSVKNRSHDQSGSRFTSSQTRCRARLDMPTW